MKLVTVAHGTRHPTGNDVARALTAAAGERLGMAAVTSYVELSEPLFADVMAALDRAGGRGAAAAVDRLPRDRGPAACRGAASAPVTLGAALGPDPRWPRRRRTGCARPGPRPGQPVVMVAAGSQDPAAMPDLERAAALLAEVWGGDRSALATLGGAGLRPAEVVAAGRRGLAVPPGAGALRRTSPRGVARRGRGRRRDRRARGRRRPDRQPRRPLVTHRYVVFADVWTAG